MRGERSENLTVDVKPFCIAPKLHYIYDKELHADIITIYQQMQIPCHYF